MAKPFDATLKQLLDLYAVDWIGWLAPVLGLPTGVDVEPLLLSEDPVIQVLDSIAAHAEPSF